MKPPRRLISALSLLATLGPASLSGACVDTTYARPTTVDDGRTDDHWLDGPRCTANTPFDPALETEVIEPGTGEIVERGMTVRVHFLVTTPSGTVLYDTHAHGSPPDDVVVGSTPVVCGFERGLLGMHAGERRLIRVPWTLAFGEDGRFPNVGPRSDLIFLVDLYLPVDHTNPVILPLPQGWSKPSFSATRPIRINR